MPKATAVMAISALMWFFTGTSFPVSCGSLDAREAWVVAAISAARN